MLSSRLVHLVEDHWESIASAVIQSIHADPALHHLKQLPEAELRDWGKRILKNFGDCLTDNGQELGHYYEEVGRRRCRELIPLHEAVRALHLLKEKICAYARDQGFRNSLEVYAEEELEHRVGDFFDTLVYHLVKGYETEMRRAAHAAA